jgi:hypothetical protein
MASDAPAGTKASDHVVVDRYTDIVGPSNEMLGPVTDGGTIEYLTVPGCWGPMITPSIRSGHEVTLRFAQGQPSNRRNALAGGYTELLISGFPSELHLDLSPAPTSHRLGSIPTCTTGDSSFDRAFWVEGSPAPQIVAIVVHDPRRSETARASM